MCMPYLPELQFVLEQQLNEQDQDNQDLQDHKEELNTARRQVSGIKSSSDVVAFSSLSVLSKKYYVQIWIRKA